MSGCAVARDGSLLSPSKIDFYNDPDDVTPISGPSLTTPMAHSSSIGTSSATTLDNYFASHQPAVKLAGVHCTTRPSKPSARLREAADSLSKSAISRKRKGSDVSLHRHVARKIVSDSDGPDVKNTSDGSIYSLKAANDTDKTTDSDGTDTDEELSQVQTAYHQTKEMGDQDCEVSQKSMISVISIDPSKGQ
jgi:hypothetical protein